MFCTLNCTGSGLENEKCRWLHPHAHTFSLRVSSAVLAELIKLTFAFSPHSVGPDGGWEWHESSLPSCPDPARGTWLIVGEGRKGRLPALGTALPFLEHQLLFPPEQESVDTTTNGGLPAMKFYNSVILWGSKEGAVGVDFSPFSGICKGKGRLWLSSGNVGFRQGHR